MGLVSSYPMWYIMLLSGIASAFVFVLTSSIVLDILVKKGKSSWSGFLYSGVGFGIFYQASLFLI